MDHVAGSAKENGASVLPDMRPAPWQTAAFRARRPSAALASIQALGVSFSLVTRSVWFVVSFFAFLFFLPAVSNRKRLRDRLCQGTQWARSLGPGTLAACGGSLCGVATVPRACCGPQCSPPPVGGGCL